MVFLDSLANNNSIGKAFKLFHSNLESKAGMKNGKGNRSHESNWEIPDNPYGGGAEAPRS